NQDMVNEATVLVKLCRYHNYVKNVGHRSFPLEAVKQLKELMKSNNNNVPSVCASPLLPLVFYPVCKGKHTAWVFHQLVKAITPISHCEMCKIPACTGCLH
uniref:Guanylate cyclase activator 2B n=1 Tax=Sphaeramia orbicularis TaxID=375764 RepID=A0A673CLT0_9TELE